MSVKKPNGYTAIIPYLVIKNAEDFLAFTQTVFDAQLLNKHMRDQKTIMHCEVKIDDSIIMFADSTEQFSVQPSGMFIYVEDADATYKKALDNGAEIVTPVTDQSYGRSGGVKDAFGNTWWITTATK